MSFTEVRESSPWCVWATKSSEELCPRWRFDGEEKLENAELGAAVVERESSWELRGKLLGC